MPANVTWVGKAQAVRHTVYISVDSATPTEYRTITIDNQAASYGPILGETVAQVASGLVAIIQQLAAGQWKNDVTASVYALNPAYVQLVGPTDGCPLVYSLSTGLSATEVTPTGPNYANNVLNYSSGALPVAGDTLIFERGADFEGPKYALDALAAIVLAAVIRYPTFNGVMGLPPVSRGGYYEYRPRYFRINAPLITIAQTGSDVTNALNILSVYTAAGNTVTVSGENVSNPDVLEIYGLPATSTMTLSGASACVAVSVGQTAILPTVKATGSLVRLGVGCTLTALELFNTVAGISVSFATLKLNNASSITIFNAAACTTASPTVGVTNDASQLFWRSSGALPVITLGNGATLDTANTPGVAITTLNMLSGSTLNDPADRIARPFALVLVNSNLEDVSIINGKSRTLTIT